MKRLSLAMLCSLAFLFADCSSSYDPMGKDGDPTCLGEKTLCSPGNDGYCANLQTDKSDCGACGIACDRGEVCSQGTCGLDCTGTTTLCTPDGQDDASYCSNVQTDPDNCGGCGELCEQPAANQMPATCTAGNCNDFVCEDGWIDCDGNATTGCEYDVADFQTDPDNCGGCGELCEQPAANQMPATCTAGNCDDFVCKDDWHDCDQDPSNGCEASETDLQTDGDNCGGCGVVCGQGKICSQGTCGLDCTGGTTLCEPGGAPYCASLQNDVNNCGECGEACPQPGPHQIGPASCTAESCDALVCESGWDNCDNDGVNGCEYDAAGFQTDVNNCGGCGVVCDQNQFCNTGQCMGVTHVANGANHTCALRTNGTVECWGYNNNGQINDDTADKHLTPTHISGLTDVQQITSGYRHNCVLRNDDTVACWGFNNNGQLGTGNRDDQAVPTAVTGGLTDVRQVSAGTYHTCALRNDDTVACWGQNQEGQLGIGNSNSYKSEPTAASGLTNVREVSAGGYHTCALRNNGTVACWGLNNKGQLGNGDNDERNAPVDVLGGLTDVQQIAAGYLHTCALRNNGTVACWGQGQFGQLGLGSGTSQSLPTDVSGVTNAQQISASIMNTCALLNDGTAMCWGGNVYGQLGTGEDGFETHALEPASAAQGLTDIQQISLGWEHTCAVQNNGIAHCWGRNRFGQLGDGTTADKYLPEAVVWP